MMLVKAINVLLPGLAAAASGVSALSPAQAAQTHALSATKDNGDVTLSRRGLKIETYHTGKMEFLTTPGAIWAPPIDTSDDAPGGYTATIADCEKLQGEMQKMEGYWIIKNFTFEGDNPGLGMPLDLYTVGTCTVLIRCYYKDLPLPLGSGDVYAWIQESIKRYAIDGTTGAYGNMTYGGNEYGWVIA